MSDSYFIKRARRLRGNMTADEKLLWNALRNRKFHGLKFLRQHPIIYQNENNQPLYFIADFYCAEKKLVVEVDGRIHDFQKEYDHNRDEILRNKNLRVLRIKNDECLDIDRVLKKVEQYI